MDEQTRRGEGYYEVFWVSFTVSHVLGLSIKTRLLLRSEGGQEMVHVKKAYMIQ